MNITRDSGTYPISVNPLVGSSLGVVTRASTEEQGNMDKTDGALGKMAGWVGCYCELHDNTKGDILLLLEEGVLVREVPDYAKEMLVKVS